MPIKAEEDESFSEELIRLHNEFEQLDEKLTRSKDECTRLRAETDTQRDDLARAHQELANVCNTRRKESIEWNAKFTENIEELTASRQEVETLKRQLKECHDKVRGTVNVKIPLIFAVILQFDTERESFHLALAQSTAEADASKLNLENVCATYEVCLLPINRTNMMSYL